jgi:hypothetical protein
MSKENKEVNVYWAPYYDVRGPMDWSFLYPKPKTLFSEIHKDKVPNKDSYFSCPAMSKKLAKTLVFKNVIESSYSYDINGDIYGDESKPFLSVTKNREPSISLGDVYKFDNSIIMFSEEKNVFGTLSSPWFSESQYTKYGCVCPARFDIGQWFRPMDIEVQMWKKEGEFHLMENEPFFYVELETYKQVNLHRFNLSETLKKYAIANAESTRMFGRGKTLLSRYKRFEDVGMREKILTEIKNNLIEEEPYKF